MLQRGSIVGYKTNTFYVFAAFDYQEIIIHIIKVKLINSFKQLQAIARRN